MIHSSFCITLFSCCMVSGDVVVAVEYEHIVFRAIDLEQLGLHPSVDAGVRQGSLANKLLFFDHNPRFIVQLSGSVARCTSKNPDEGGYLLATWR